MAAPSLARSPGPDSSDSNCRVCGELDGPLFRNTCGCRTLVHFECLEHERRQGDVARIVCSRCNKTFKNTRPVLRIAELAAQFATEPDPLETLKELAAFALVHPLKILKAPNLVAECVRRISDPETNEALVVKMFEMLAVTQGVFFRQHTDTRTLFLVPGLCDAALSRIDERVPPKVRAAALHLLCNLSANEKTALEMAANEHLVRTAAFIAQHVHDDPDAYEFSLLANLCYESRLAATFSANAAFMSSVLAREDVETAYRALRLIHSMTFSSSEARHNLRTDAVRAFATKRLTSEHKHVVDAANAVLLILDAPWVRLVDSAWSWF